MYFLRFSYFILNELLHFFVNSQILLCFNIIFLVFSLNFCIFSYTTVFSESSWHSIVFCGIFLNDLVLLGISSNHLKLFSFCSIFRYFLCYLLKFLLILPSIFAFIDNFFGIFWYFLVVSSVSIFLLIFSSIFFLFSPIYSCIFSYYIHFFSTALYFLEIIEFSDILMLFPSIFSNDLFHAFLLFSSSSSYFSVIFRLLEIHQFSCASSYIFVDSPANCIVGRFRSGMS